MRLAIPKNIAIAMTAICFVCELYLYLSFGKDQFTIHSGRIVQVLFAPFLIVILIGSKPTINRSIVYPIIYLIALFVFQASISFLYSLETRNQRSYLEIFLLIYQISFFCILPCLFIKNEEDLLKFLNIISVLLWLSVLIGFVDFVIRISGYDLIGRHLIDGRDVGVRFHGLFGEPRDAAAVVGFLMAVEIVRHYFGAITSKIAFKKILILSFATMLTQSMSFLVGLCIFLVFFSVRFFSFKGAFFVFILCSFVGFNYWFGLFESNRIINYFNDLGGVISFILADTDQVISKVYSGQMPNLVPIRSFFNRFLSNDFHLVMFGSGLGTVYESNLASGFLPADGISPKSNISKMLIEQGVFGLLLYASVHFYAFQHLGKLERLRYMEISFFYVFALSLAHRSPVNFMCIGIAIVIVSVVSRSREKSFTHLN